MQGKKLTELENELWNAADQLRANSKLTASQYSMPVLGLIFLRHAYNRFIKVKEKIEATLPVHPQRGRRPITKQDFLQETAMYLPEETQFEYLVNLPESVSIGEAIDNAMKRIEEEYESLKGVLPKKFSSFESDLLRELLRIFNKEVLRTADGDLFGKIYEFFLNKFAMTGAQEGGEFFTPMSLVQTIVNVIEPSHGTVFDPACGSAGMFVQTGYFIERDGEKPANKVTFFGQEKADLNTKLAKMNLTVHGLEGKILEGNTFYEDKHNLVGKCDFVMANPPFNVDGVDKKKDSVKKDPRLMLDGKVNLPRNDNANYLWIQYFYNYLKPASKDSKGGRAGFVMASSASDAGHSEKDIREKLVKTGAVDVMMAIGNNFFYTRSLPCTLWFFDRNKEVDAEQKDKTLMLDARKIYRKVTSTINDFSPEQMQNILCVVGLYRGNTERFQTTIQGYLKEANDSGKEAIAKTKLLKAKLLEIEKKVKQFADNNKALKLQLEIENWDELLQLQDELISQEKSLKADAVIIETFADHCKTLRKPQDKVIRTLKTQIDDWQREHQLNKEKDWKQLALKDDFDELKELQLLLSGNPDGDEDDEIRGLLHNTEYFYKQVKWLTTRFPDGVYTDVEGLCKVVTQAEIEEKDWSLSPGRYVGVAIEEDEDFDYEERLAEIHLELDDLNGKAVELAKLISENYKGLEI